MRSQPRKHACQPVPAFTLPSHWSPTQALAVFECLDLMQQQLWLAYGPEIQRAWRGQLVRHRPTPDLNAALPF